MAEFRIAVSLASLIPPGTSIAGQTFPTLSAAVREVTEAAHRLWVDYAMGAPLPSGRAIKNSTGAYARSIQLRQVNDLTGEVFTELPYARAIEEGTAARDLKDMLGSSMKVRIVKNGPNRGKRYLIIPFRFYGPNSVLGAQMPQAIADWWKGVPAKDSSHITAHTWRASGTGAIAFKTETTGRFRLVRGEVVQVRARKYHWGAKLTASDIARMGLGEKAQRRYAGMYRFDKPARQGGGRHGQFLNFRVMMEGSPGWRVAARPGLHVAQTVSEKTRAIAERAFPKAIEADIRRMLAAE